MARLFPLALVPVELLLKARLSVGISCQGAQWNFEFPAANRADPDGRSATQPFHNPNTALAHGRTFESCLAGF